MSKEVLQGVTDVRDGEIVGIHASSLGRSCTRHVAWQEVMLVDEETGASGGAGQAPETVVKAILIEHGQESCTVGFIPRHIALGPDVSQRLHGQFTQIIEPNAASRASKTCVRTMPPGLVE